MKNHQQYHIGSTIQMSDTEFQNLIETVTDGLQTIIWTSSNEFEFRETEKAIRMHTIPNMDIHALLSDYFGVEIQSFHADNCEYPTIFICYKEISNDECNTHTKEPIDATHDIQCPHCQQTFLITNIHWRKDKNRFTICPHCHKQVFTDKRPEFTQKQIARLHEVHEAVYQLCKTLTQNDNLEKNMNYINEIADTATTALAMEGKKVYYPAIIMTQNSEYVTNVYDPQCDSPFHYGHCSE